MNKLILNYCFDDYFDYEITWDEYYDFKKAYLNNCTKEQLIDIINVCVDEDDFREYVDVDLLDTFSDDAYSAYKENIDYETNPYEYYGLKRSDIDGV